MKYAIVLSDEKGESHFKDGELGFQSVNFAPPAPPVELTEYVSASKLVFFKIPVGWFGDWHPAPKKQFFCCLSGEAEITTTDGQKRSFKAGDIFLLEDISGRGHRTRVVGNQDFLAAIVQRAATTT